MKWHFNWRRVLLCALFVVGFLAMMFVFGEDERPLSSWLPIRLILSAVAVGCLYTLCRLTKKWEREGKI